MEKELSIEHVAIPDVGNVYYCHVDVDAACILSDNPVTLPETACQRRKNEILAVACLISRIGMDPGKLQYNDQGKPFLKDASQKISISHSDTYASIFLADRVCGVDVERISKRTLAVAGKYLGDAERRMIGREMPEFYHTLLWSAKETLYKMTGLPDFRKEMTALHLPVPGSGYFPVRVKIRTGETVYPVFYTTFDQHVLTWAYEG